MLVADILRIKGSTVKTIRADETAMTCAQRLNQERIGALVVSADGRRIDGIISERDIAYALAKHGNALEGVPVGHLMTKTVITCTPRDTILETMKTMTQRRVRHLPVKDGDSLIGIVSSGDILKSRIEEVQLEAAVLRDAVIAAR